MELTKGLTGRRICGGIQVVFGVLFAINAIYSAVTGRINIMNFLFAAFLIMTGILGIAGTTRGRIIAYVVCGIICSLIFILSTIVLIVGIVAYNDQFPDDNAGLVVLIVATVVAASAFIVSVIGVICAFLPFCG